MLASYDTTSQCLRHPGQPIGGICALCLKERLTRLACSRCGGLGSSRVATISCSCTPLEYASKPVQDPAKEVHSRTIASLIESDIEDSKRLSPKVEQDDRSDGGAHRLRTSRSISLGNSSRSLSSHGWECRSARESRRKTGLSERLEGDRVALETNATNANEKSDSPMPGVPKVADTDQKDNERARKGSMDKDDAARITCEEVSILVSNMDEEKRGFPLGPARLMKAKSTGWVLNDGGKASPSCNGGRIPAAPKTAKGKRFGIFRRRSPSATTALSQGPAEMCTELEQCGSCGADAKRKSCSDIPEAKTSRILKQGGWATNLLMGRNSNAKQEDTPSGSSSSSVSSLITTECEGKEELRRCRSQGRATSSWSKSLLLSPWWVLGRLARS